MHLVFLHFTFTELHQLSSVSQSCPTLCDPMQHTRPPCPSPTPGAYSNSCPLSQWCHPTISPSVIPFSSRLQSFPASGSFQMSQYCASGGRNVGVSASASELHSYYLFDKLKVCDNPMSNKSISTIFSQQHLFTLCFCVMFW